MFDLTECLTLCPPVKVSISHYDKNIRTAYRNVDSIGIGRYHETMANETQTRKRKRNRPKGAVTLSPQFIAWAKEHNLTHVEQTIRDLERFRALKMKPSESRAELEEKRKKAAELMRRLDEALMLLPEER